MCKPSSRQECPIRQHDQHCFWCPQLVDSPEGPPLCPPDLLELFIPAPFIGLPIPLAYRCCSLRLSLHPFLSFYKSLAKCPIIPQLYNVDSLRTSSTCSQSSCSGSLPLTWSTSIGTYISFCPPRACSVLLVVCDTTSGLRLIASFTRTDVPHPD